MPKVLAIHSQEDDTLKMLSERWMVLVQKDSGFDGYDLDNTSLVGTSASRRANLGFGQTVKDPDVELIVGLAHGRAEGFEGSDSLEVLFPPIDDISTKVVHLLSCFSADTVGIAFDRAGASGGFIGYHGLVSIVDPQVSAAEIRSTIDKFLECDLKIDFALAAGETVANAIDAARKEFSANGLDEIGYQLEFHGKDINMRLKSKAGALSARGLSEREMLPPNQIGPQTL